MREHGVRIAPSSYYAARGRPASARARRDALVLEHIRRIFFDPRAGRGLYGARKIYRQMIREHAAGEHPELGHVPRCQIERLMRADGLQGARRGRRYRTTRPDPGAARPQDLVDRKFTPTGPNRLWVVDFTYVATFTGMAFTAFVIDAYSRRIVGWRTADAMPTGLPLDALEMAIFTRSQADELIIGVIHHSDAGSQYTSITYTERLAGAGAVASIGSIGDSYDNALAETIIGLYKTECVHHDGPVRGVDDLELRTLDWVHWWNHHRLHARLGYRTPVEHENAYHQQHTTEPMVEPTMG